MKSNLTLLFALVSFLGFSQNALHFDGINDTIKTVNPGPIGSANRTIELWVKTSNSISSQRVLVDYGTMVVGTRFTLNIINFGKLRMEVGGNGFNSTQSIADGNWHHVAITYDHTATNKFAMYIDGILEVSQNTTVAVNTASSPIYIGRRNDGTGIFEGTIDELRIWNVARTATEISSNMNNEFCMATTGLVAYYDFNQGIAGGANPTETTLTDKAGTNNGTLANFALTGNTSNWVAGKSLTVVGGSSVVTQITDSACVSYTSPSGNHVWTASGTYSDTLKTAGGCDSLLSVTVSIKKVNTNVLQSGARLSAAATGAKYQWVDCSNGFAILPGDTFSIYTASANGDYAVIVTQNGCSDTSSCLTVTGIGLFENELNNGLSIYPNPTSGAVNLELTNGYSKALVEILDVNGARIYSGEYSNNGAIQLNLDLAKGLYQVRVSTDGELMTKSLIIQ